MTLFFSICHLSHFELLVGPVTLFVVFYLMTTVVFLRVVPPSSLLSVADGAASVPVLDDVDRAFVGLSTVVDVKNSASESLRTRSVVELVLDV